tara:strand:- start:378 stop:2681 length:2304 start_codon:yes stop_codon:yes gene_type:complete
MRNYRKILFKLIVLSNSLLFTSSYDIIGRIYDFDTQEPIQNVNIFIDDLSIGTISDKNGFFSLSGDELFSEKIQINFTIIGYEKKILLIDLSNHNDCINCNSKDLGKIFIKYQPIELSPVYTHDHENKSKQISDINISESEIQENLKVNIASTLSNYPNIGINSFGSVTAKPALRGFSGDRFLLTNNGNESGDLSQSSIDHVITLDISEVSKIDIIRGPKALLYGPNAIGGVINTTLLGDPSIRADRVYQRYIVGTESFNKSQYNNLMYYLPFKKNQINFFLSSKKTGNEYSSIGELDNTNSKTFNYKTQLTNYNRLGFISFGYDNYSMNYGIPPAAGIGHANGVDILLDKKTRQVRYHTDLLIKNFNTLDINFNSINYLHLEDSSIENDNIDEVFQNGDFHVGLSKETKEIKIELSSNSSKLGLEINKKIFEGYGLYFTPSTKELMHSLYGYNEIKNKNFDFLYSFRFGHLNIVPNISKIQYNNIDSTDVVEKSFNTFSISFGLVKKVNNMEFNSWIMQTMRAPRVEELFSDGPHLGTYAYEIGNPGLKVEKISGIENSMSYIKNSSKFSIVTFYTVSPYYYQMSKMGNCPEALDWDPLSQTSHPCAGADFIEWGSSSAGWLTKYNSIGTKVEIGGIEIDFNYELENLLIEYNFSALRGDNASTNQPLSYMNPDKHILSFSYKTNNADYKIKFSKIEEQNRLGEFETYTPSAFLTDVLIKYQIKKHNIIFQLNNIFDKEYYNHLSRIKNIYAEPGRNINIIYKLAI